MVDLSYFRRTPWFFGWNIVAVGMVILAMGYGARYSFAVFFPELLKEFGWSRDLGASILSTHLIFYGLTAPFAGHLVDRLGPRWTMVLGTILMVLGMSLSSLAYTPWHFYLYFGVMAGVGLCLIASCPLTVLLRTWFEHKRGTAIALIFVGEGGAYACYPAAVSLIDSLGWRDGYAVIGLGLAAIFLPLILWTMVTKPEDLGLVKDGQVYDESISKKESIPTGGLNLTLGQAVGTSKFYLVCFSAFAIWGLSHHVAVAHQVALAMDAGIDKMTASAIIALGGPAFMMGSLFGFMSDRLGREVIMTIGSFFGSVGLISLTVLQQPSQVWILYVYAMLFNFGFGLCVPTVAAVATDIFQGPHSGSTIGMVWFTFAIGGAIGPWLGGYLFELTGGYDLALWIAAIVLWAGCLATWLAAPRKINPRPRNIKMA